MSSKIICEYRRFDRILKLLWRSRLICRLYSGGRYYFQSCPLFCLQGGSGSISSWDRDPPPSSGAIASWNRGTIFWSHCIIGSIGKCVGWPSIERLSSVSFVNWLLVVFYLRLILVISALDFKIRVDPLTCMLHCFFCNGTSRFTSEFHIC